MKATVIRHLEAYDHVNGKVIVAMYDAQELVRIWATLYPDADFRYVKAQITAGVFAVEHNERDAVFAIQNTADRAREMGLPEGFALAVQLDRLYRLVRPEHK